MRGPFFVLFCHKAGIWGIGRIKIFIKRRRCHFAVNQKLHAVNIGKLAQRIDKRIEFQAEAFAVFDGEIQKILIEIQLADAVMDGKSQKLRPVGNDMGDSPVTLPSLHQNGHDACSRLFRIG